MRKSYKLTIISVIIITILLLSSGSAVAKRLNLPPELVSAIKNFLSLNPNINACDYKDGMIILVKPVATGEGEGRYEAGDIVEIRDMGKICSEYGNKNALSKLETVKLLPLYYPHKLTEEQITELTAMEKEEVLEPSPDGKEMIPVERIVKMRTKGVDYTAVLDATEINKVSNLEDIKRLPEIDLNIIREKTETEKAVISISDYKPKENYKTEEKSYISRVINFLIYTAYAQPLPQPEETIITVDTGGTGDYASLNAAIAAEQRNLTTSNEQLTFKCEASDDSADTAAVNVTGYTVDGTRYIKIWTDPAGSDRHAGIWSDTKYRLIYEGATSYTYTLSIAADSGYTQIIGLQVATNFSGSYYAHAIRHIYGAYGCVVEKNIVRGITTAKAGYGILGGSYSDLTISNNIVYGFKNAAGTGIRTGVDTNETHYTKIYNNTVFNNTFGISGRETYTPDDILKNNISLNNSGGDYNEYWVASSDKNVSSDATAPGTTVAINQTSYADYFTDYTTSDFHLKGTGLSLFGISGDNLSGTFTTDIDGDTRSVWDVGADEYVASGGGETAAPVQGEKVIKEGMIFKRGVIFKK